MRTHSHVLAPLSIVLASLCLLPLAARAQGDGGGASGSHFAAAGGEFLANQTTNFTQYEPKVAMRPDGQQIVVVWASAAGADVYARVFNGAGLPVTGQIQCDTNFSNGTQDEPTVAVDETGRFLVAWSDRQGSDGFDMGVFARIFNANGTPITPDFQVNVTAQQSQWEPFAAARPGGGWIVGFSGTSGGKTYMRIYTANGAPLTGDVDVAQVNTKQIDPVPAITRDGTTFFSWTDFNGKAGTGNGTSIFGRFFDALGNPSGNEFQINTTNPGTQENARTAADGLGRFLVVWEDQQNDANSRDIHARRYSKAGFALSPEWEVNTVKAGDQVNPAVAFDWVGNSIVVWEDNSLGDGLGEIKAQRYNPLGVPLGGEFTVNSIPASDQTTPAVAVDWAGENYVVAYANLGATLDVFARRFRFSPITQLGTATPGGTFGLNLDLPGSGGLYRIVLMALGTSPGLPLPDGRKLPLNYDILFSFMLANPDGGGAFLGFTGPMPSDSTAFASGTLQNMPALSGLTFYISAVTLDLNQSGLNNQLRNVTNAFPLHIQ